MELPPINMDDFNKYRQGAAVIKDSDMPDTIKLEAKDFVASGIEKFSGQNGIDLEVSDIKFLPVGGSFKMKHF